MKHRGQLEDTCGTQGTDGTARGHMWHRGQLEDTCETQGTQGTARGDEMCQILINTKLNLSPNYKF